MSRELNPTQAFRLGRLYYGSELQMPLSAYAYAQSVILADLMAWKKRLNCVRYSRTSSLPSSPVCGAQCCTQRQYPPGMKSRSQSSVTTAVNI